MSHSLLVVVPDGYAKTDLVRARALEAALEPLVRETAVALVATAGRFDHLERVQRLHRFVRDSVPYVREPIETLQSGTLTLTRGGDCDDHVILLLGLAWSIRYPFLVEPVGAPEEPDHYTARIGIPPASNPHGDRDTTWFAVETTVPAQFNEPLESFARLSALEFLG